MKDTTRTKPGHSFDAGFGFTGSAGKVPVRQHFRAATQGYAKGGKVAAPPVAPMPAPKAPRLGPVKLAPRPAKVPVGALGMLDAGPPPGPYRSGGRVKKGC